MIMHNAVEALILVAKFTGEQYTTINQSIAGHFNPRVSAVSTAYKWLYEYTCKQLTQQRPSGWNVLQLID